MYLEFQTTGIPTLSGDIVLEHDWVRVESANPDFNFDRKKRYKVTIQELKQ